MTTRSHLAGIATFVVIACAVAAAEQRVAATEQSTTMAHVARTYHDAAGELVRALPESVHRVTVHTPDDSLGLLRIAVEAALSERGTRITEDAADNVPHVILETTRLSVTVSALRRKMLVWKRDAERSVDIELSAQLVERGTITWQQRAHMQTREWVPVSALNTDTPDAHFAVDVPRDQLAFALETGVILSSIVVVLYLFFTQ